MDRDFEELFQKAGERHGHLCPSLCFGVRGALLVRKIAQQRGITTGSALLEASSKCIKDGVMTVLGDDRVVFDKTPGTCRLTWKDKDKEVVVAVRKDIRLKMGELNESLQPDTEKFQQEGLAVLSKLDDKDIFEVE
jgi:formylmethanofuran dehydrogenase subunit E